MPLVSRGFVRTLLVGLALLLAGCGGNKLEGSLAEAFDLGFSDILIRRTEDAVQITYLRSAGNEVVMRVTVVLEGFDVSGGGSINLASEYAPGHPRAAVSRAVDGEPVRSLPPVVQGNLTLGGSCQAGEGCDGTFSLRFGEGGDLGSGRTLVGSFSGTVQGAQGL